jgi:hypothetical protein
VISNIAFSVAHQQLIYSVTLASYNHAPARAHLATATRSPKRARCIGHKAVACSERPQRRIERDESLL